MDNIIIRMISNVQLVQSAKAEPLNKTKSKGNKKK